MQAEGVVVLHIDTVWKSQNSVMVVDVFKSTAEKSLYFLALFELYFLNSIKELFYILCWTKCQSAHSKGITVINQGQEKNQSKKALLPCSEGTDTTRDAEMEIWHICAHRTVKTLVLPRTPAKRTLCSTGYNLVTQFVTLHKHYRYYLLPWFWDWLCLHLAASGHIQPLQIRDVNPMSF